MAVGGDAHADAARCRARMPKSCLPSSHIAADELRVVGVIDGVRGVGAEVGDLVADGFREVVDDGVFEFEGAVIGSDGYGRRGGWRLIPAWATRLGWR